MTDTNHTANQHRSLTAQQTCEKLQVSQNTLYKLLKNKQLQGVKIGGQWRFSPQTIAETLTGGTK